MGDKIKSLLFLLFIVSILLLMIGSVNAINADENNNLETSQDLNDELSITVDDSEVNLDNTVSNHLTLSNVDSEPIEDNLSDLNSNDGVSNKYGAAINSKDSENNILTANGPNIVIEHNKVLTPVVCVGDTVSFEIFGRNHGSNYGNEYILIDMLYGNSELQYVGFTPGLNPDTNSYFNDLYSERIRDVANSHIQFGYRSNGWFDNGYCFNFTVHFKALKVGDYGCHAYVNDINAGQSCRAKIVNVPYFDLSNTASKDSVAVGSIVSFEIFGRNLGTNFGEDFVPIHVLYDHAELEYAGFTVGRNPDNGVYYDGAYPEPTVNDNGILFKYNSNRWFDNGHCFNFTVHFKAVKAGEFGCFVYVNDWDGGKATRVNVIQDSDFKLTNTPSKDSVALDSDVSFEIFARNLGSNFNQEYIPIDFYYNPSELQYTGLTVGRNPDNGWVSTENYQRPVEYYSDHIRVYYRSGYWFENNHCLNFTANFKALKEGQSTVVSVINWTQTDNHQISSTSSIMIKSDSKFALTTTPSKSLTVVGSDISFEIFARNLGSNFNQEYILIDFYYNPSELQYTGLTVGRNPDNGWVSTENYQRPVEYYNDHITVYYYSNWWFENNHCLNFTANFKALSEAQSTRVVAVINWMQTEFHQVYSISDVPIKRDSDFRLEHKSKQLFANVEDDVTVEVFSRNLGSTYSGDYVYVKVKYNPDELEYAGFAPGRNPDTQLYYEENYKTPIVNATKGELIFGYAAYNDFQIGYSFNFTVNFKALKEGKVETIASIDWEQIESHHVEATAQAIVTDANFVLENTPITKIVSIGDNASFKITAHNLQGTYYGTGIGFDLFYDPNNLEYIGYNVIQKPNGDFILDSTDTKLTKRFEGLLSASESEDGHLHFAYTPTSGAGDDCSFDFDVNFKVLQDGDLESTAALSWTKSEAKKVSALGLAFAGQSGLNLTKKVHDEFVSVGDDVYYDVCLINNGTVPFINTDGYFFVNDYYPVGLEFVGYEAHTPGVTIVRDDPWNYVGIKQALPSDGCWAPGSVLNVTLHFKAAAPGILCNWVFGPDGKEVYSSVVVNDTDLNLTKTVREEFVQLNEIVYFNIYVKNNGSVPYYNHYNSTKDLLIYDYYPEGLIYEGFEVVSDSQGGSFKVQTDDNNRLNITYTPDGEKWYSGSYINVTLKFNATKYGKLTNKANVRWIWKDWDEFQEIDLWDNASVTVYEPQFSITKISNYDLVEIGKPVNFTIIVTNTGMVNLTGVYIKDNNYTEGLLYSDYSNKNLWSFNDKDTWNYTKPLNVGESASLELTFITTTIGEKNNTAIAGHNITDEILNSTDKVNVRSIPSFDFDVNEPLGSNDPDEVDKVPEGDVPITVPEDIPDVNLPYDNVPAVNVPDVDLPDNEVPAVNVPDVDLPDDNVPAVNVPDVDLPDDNVPAVNIPDKDISDGVSVEDIPDVDLPNVNFVDEDVPTEKATDENDSDVGRPSEISSYDDIIGNNSSIKFPIIGVPDEVPPDEEIPPVEVPEEDPSERNLTDEEILEDDDFSDDIPEDGIEKDTKKNVETNKNEVNKEKPTLKKVNQPVTGNPFVVLILCLISLCFVQIKSKK